MTEAGEGGNEGQPDTTNTTTNTTITTTLEDTLSSFSDSITEQQEEAHLREQVLKKLQNIISIWVLKLAKEKNEGQVGVAGNTKVVAFGSHRILGYSNSSGSDLDLLCMVSSHVSRVEIFSHLPPLLQSRIDVSDFLAIPDAYVPVMKFKFLHVPVDLVFAVLDVARLPSNLHITLRKDTLDFQLDEKSLLSLNGFRVTEKIISLVPDIDSFRVVLRAIKLWAKRRGIYSNLFGFLGGASWTLLVAYVCQKKAGDSPKEILWEFFRVFAEWPWPQPVILEGSTDGWNLMEGSEPLMPIITPVSPMMNSAFNVSKSTRIILIEEIRRGRDCAQRILQEKSVSWEVLFEKEDFFKRYKMYIQLDIIGPNEEVHRKWEGFVESKIRTLTQFLERVPEIHHVHPHPHCLDKISTFPTKATSLFIGVSLKFPLETAALLIAAVLEFVHLLCNWKSRCSEMNIKAFLLQRNLAAISLDLPNLPVSPTPTDPKPSSPSVPCKSSSPPPGLSSFITTTSVTITSSPSTIGNSKLMHNHLKGSYFLYRPKIPN